MLGLDTNVLVRLLVSDDASQTRKARELVEGCAWRGEQVLVSLPVIVEAEWVLRSRYEMDKGEVISIFRDLLAVRELTLDEHGSVEEALFHWQDSRADFVDCLIVAHHRRLGCTRTATFDARAARLPGFVVP